MFLIAYHISVFISSRVWTSLVSVCLTGLCHWERDPSKGFVRWKCSLRRPAGDAFPCQFSSSDQVEQLETPHQCPCPICHNRIRLGLRNFLSMVATKGIISFHVLRSPASILGSLAFCSVLICGRLEFYLPCSLHAAWWIEMAERNPSVAVVIVLVCFHCGPNS